MLRKVILGLLFVLALSTNINADFPVVGAPSNAPTQSYPELRFWWQTQEWWLATGVSDEGEHIHVECAWPVHQTVSGTFYADLRIQLHNFPPYNPTTDTNVIKHIRIMDDKGVTLYENKSVKIFADANGNADYWIRNVAFDTTKQYNGLREYRLTANMQRGFDVATKTIKRRFQSSGWCVNVNNPGRSSASGRDWKFHVARGWYAGLDYANAGLRDFHPNLVYVNGKAVNGQFKPLKGSWRFKATFTDNGADIVKSILTVDPDFHANKPGTVLLERNGPYNDYITVDTTKFTNGVHRFVFIAKNKDASGVNSGVFVMPVVIQN
jgi:hypothetical protein